VVPAGFPPDLRPTPQRHGRHRENALRVRGGDGGHGVPFGKLRAGFRLRRAIPRDFAQDDKLKVTPSPPFMSLVLEGRQIASRLSEKVPGFAVAFEAVAGFFLGRYNGG
jgi:hypothetical protein